MSEIQDAVEELRGIVERETVECDCWTVTFSSRKPIAPKSNCEECNGTGRIPNPAYAGLLNVLKGEQCDLVSGSTWYVTRTIWQELADSGVKGALRGAIDEVVFRMPSEFQLAYVRAWDRIVLRVSGSALGALAAVKESVRGETH